ncbi:S-layer homology domain-containing protein [Dendrosporobacter sp. 1207_IL3150]|uniref:S-layer homology domain-containing protein n=1 Tax=Dendrosporobacter sp. 1207_IL3150 TaxID=3084054 RepID=UPI002FD88E06
MKKRLAAMITTALVVGVASTTFAAANPFVDVPAKHWAYDAVTKLAQAGIVDGYNDGTFRGDKTITRYEMAQIVAKAMVKSDKADAAQKAALDKLAVEFSAELNNLGVRVAKLEASQSNIKFTGDARVRWVQLDRAAGGGLPAEPADNDFTYRLILGLSANVNDNTSFTGKIMTNGHRPLGDDDTTATDQTGGNEMKIAEMALTTKNVLNTGAAVTVGRYSQKIGATGYFLATTGMVDGVKASFGNKVKTTVGYANFKNAIAGVTTTDYQIEDAAFVTADYNLSKATALNASYVQEQNGDISDYKVYDLGFTTKFAPGWVLTGEYLKNVADVPATRLPAATFAPVEDPYGYVVKLGYKGANFAKKDTWGASVEYFKFENGVLTAGGDYAAAGIANQANNREGYALTGNYTLAKNMVITGVQTFGSKLVHTGADRSEYSRVQVDYKF